MNPTIYFSEIIENQVFKTHWFNFVSQITSQNNHHYNPDLQTIMYEDFDNERKPMWFESSLNEVFNNHFTQALKNFKSDVNQYVFDKIPNETKLTYLKITKNSLNEQYKGCQLKLSEYSDIWYSIINEAISFTDNYILQITDGVVYYNPPVKKLNWTANVNMLAKLIVELSEPNKENGNSKLVEQPINDMIDFFSYYFLCKGKPLNRDTLLRSSKSDKVSGSKLLTRKSK
jgi:hypothetical protein